ncbi:hypothetical protein LSTR_LSTR001157 [Laodelphax striatellus]|uniref:Exonuclease domain-containing protein n=1 Tax=Laodelphax striatellus TaxID=195883 RepID=A0A482X221_LAOST|nr:hypothetical protein LSTR_LSTR001157 [Laodelphax striatellus]
MSEVSTRQSERMKRKKKKLAALLDLTELNEKDRMKQEKILSQQNMDDSGGTNDSIANESKIKSKKKRDEQEGMGENDDGKEEHGRKRQKTNGESEAVLDSSKMDNENTLEDQTTWSLNYNMSMDEYKKLKKELRDRKNELKVIPRILLNETGNHAAVECKYRIPMFISDIQHFIMYSQLGHHAPVKARWCDIEKFNRISHTVLLIIEGVTVYDLVSNESACPHFADLKLKVEFLSPFNYDGILIEELAAVPLTRSQMAHLENSLHVNGIRNRNMKFRVLRTIFPVGNKGNNKDKHEPEMTGNESEKSNHENAGKPLDSSNNDQFPRTELLLSAWQMVAEGYPIPLRGEMENRYADFVMTKDEYTEVTATSPMWGVDCEMCLTSINKSELTRISIVDENYKTVYDTLVKPPNKITNYLTKFSGIDKKMMENVTKTLEDVQEDLRKLLPSDVILVGQSLNFDLIAMKMMHPYVIDTSIIFNLSGSRSRKTKLAVLSLMFLNEVIQGGRGHDSVEDSATALKLVKLKLENSIDFGDAVLSGPLSIEKPTDKKSSRLDTKQKNDNKRRKEEKVYEEIQFTSLFSYVTKGEGKYASIIAEEPTLSSYRPYIEASSVDGKDVRVDSVPVKSNMAAIEKTCSQAATQSFVVAHLKLNKNETIKDVNSWCGDIYKSLAFNSLFAVMLAGSEDSEAHGAFMFTIKQKPLVFARNSIKAQNQ